MKTKLFTRLLALLLVCAAVCGFACAAPAARFVFSASEPDTNGCFTLTATAYDTVFRGVQFAIRYDPAVVMPVDETGKSAATFGEFAEKQCKAFSTAGTELNARTGLIDFTLFLMPGTEGDNIDENGLMTVGGEGEKLYTFTFKLLKEGDAAFQVATEAKGEPYRPACPEGVIVLTETEGAAEVQFDVPELLGTGKSESFEKAPPAAPAQPEKTADTLLNGAILLPIGSYAALYHGGVVAIYPGEREVVSYIKNNRTFVPIRFVAEKLGAKVDWDNATRTVIVEKDDHKLLLPVGSMTYTLDGKELTLDAPAEILNSRTMVPLRLVAEGLGNQVEWDAANRVAIVVDGEKWDMADALTGEAVSKALTMIAMYKGFV